MQIFINPDNFTKEGYIYAVGLTMAKNFREGTYIELLLPIFMKAVSIEVELNPMYRKDKDFSNKVYLRVFEDPDLNNFFNYECTRIRGPMIGTRNVKREDLYLMPLPSGLGYMPSQEFYDKVDMVEGIYNHGDYYRLVNKVIVMIHIEYGKQWKHNQLHV